MYSAFWISKVEELYYCTIRVAKPNALISFAVTAKLICTFGFAYAESWFSNEEAYKVVSRPTKNKCLVSGNVKIFLWVGR